MTSGRAAALLAALTLAVLLGLLPYRVPIDRVWGDEGTYLAMTASLVEDGDLRFDDRDRQRLEAADPGRATVILQRGDGQVAYSKPVLYPLVSAPFYAIFGDLGPIVLNATALLLAMLLAYACLRRLGSPGQAALVLVTFLGAAVVLPYVLWRMSDLFQAALALCGFVLCFFCERGDERGDERPATKLDALLLRPMAPYLGAALLGLVASMRLSNGALAAAPVLAALLPASASGEAWPRRARRAALLAAAAAAAYFLVVVVTGTMTGAANPYRAVRSSFNQDTGYPVGADASGVGTRFESELATHHTGIEPPPGGRRVLYAGLYFLIGRHSGLLFYFPAALMLLVAALARPDRVSWALLGSFAAVTGFFLGWLPWNYFGGDTFIGNRYLLPAYPALLIALQRLPGPRLLTITWLLAATAYASAAVSVLRTRDFEPTSQSHAYAGVFRLLPYESIAPDIAGRRDRYWQGHFVRFVDPYAEVAPWHFELAAGGRPAEILAAQWQPAEKIRLLVTTEAPRLSLQINDYRRTKVIELEAARETVVDIDLAPPWRRHLFWWDPQVLYNARALRLSVQTPDGSAASAEIRYLGLPESLEETFAYRRLIVDVPERVAAGSRTPIRVAVQNLSSLTWEDQGVLPVYAKYRLYDAAGAELLVESQPIRPTAAIPSGDTLDLTSEVEWPAAAGVYIFEVDLVLSRIAWFQHRLGEPVLRRQIVVESSDR